MISPAQNPKFRARAGIIAVIIAVWLLGIGSGLRALYTYETKAGSPANAGPRRPQGSRIPAAKNSTLIMFAHPQCPCSRASLGNLEEIMAKSQGRLSAYVVFFVPSGAKPDWTKTTLCHSAARIPGVKVIYDIGGAEMERFGAKTSGQILLYGPDGHLQFDGGITAGRGHYGDNAGSDDIVSLLRSESPQSRSTPVYGCALGN